MSAESYDKVSSLFPPLHSDILLYIIVQGKENKQ